MCMGVLLIHVCLCSTYVLKTTIFFNLIKIEKAGLLASHHFAVPAPDCHPGASVCLAARPCVGHPAHAFAASFAALFGCLGTWLDVVSMSWEVTGAFPQTLRSPSSSLCSCFSPSPLHCSVPVSFQGKWTELLVCPCVKNGHHLRE